MESARHRRKMAAVDRVMKVEEEEEEDLLMDEEGVEYGLDLGMAEMESGEEQENSSDHVQSAGSPTSLDDGDGDGNGNGDGDGSGDDRQESFNEQLEEQLGGQEDVGTVEVGGAGTVVTKDKQCDQCKKIFSNAANMRRHRACHSGVKPYHCRICQRRFFRKDHMREHMSHKHGQTQLECYFCQEAFTREKDLFQHVIQEHSVNPKELHCPAPSCSFSGNTLGRFLWHLSNSHPRKISSKNSIESPPTSRQRQTSAVDFSRRKKQTKTTLSMATDVLTSSEVGYSSINLTSRPASVTRFVSILPEKFSPLTVSPNKYSLTILPTDGPSTFGVPGQLPIPSPVLPPVRSTGGSTGTGTGTVLPAGTEKCRPAGFGTVMPAGSGSSSNRRKSSMPVRVGGATSASSATGWPIPVEGVSPAGELEIDILESALKEEQVWQETPAGMTGNGLENNNNNNHFDDGDQFLNGGRQIKKGEFSNGGGGEEEPAHKCPHCLIVYPDNVLFSLHKMLHAGGDHPYRCAQCHGQFPNRYEFYAHIVSHGAAGSGR